MFKNDIEFVKLYGELMKILDKLDKDTQEKKRNKYFRDVGDFKNKDVFKWQRNTQEEDTQIPSRESTLSASKAVQSEPKPVSQSNQAEPQGVNGGGQGNMAYPQQVGTPFRVNCRGQGFARAAPWRGRENCNPNFNSSFFPAKE